MTKVYIHYNQANHRGPGMVAKNLLKGLESLGIDLVKQPKSADYIGCLQDPGPLANYFPDTTVMGPNLFVLPNENSTLVGKFNKFIVPSIWVKDIYKSFPMMQNKRIDVWPVGIDTEEWRPLNWPKSLDLFVYVKNTSTSHYETIHNILKAKKINFETIRYGEYVEEDLKNLCKKSNGCILLTDTESQGIAYMQILSSGLPCLVLNKTVWEYQNQFGKYNFNASSTPYFDDNCGVVFNDIMNFDEMLSMFMVGLRNKNFDPRTYILNNHTLVKSAHNYMEILKS
jgi:hypothetical protein